MLFLLLGMIPGVASGQDSSGFKCTFDGSLRYRFEKWDNMNTLYYGKNPAIGNPDDFILLQRIIAGSTIRFNEKLNFSLHIQDSRAFGWSLSHWKEPDAFKKHPQENMDPYYIMNPQEEFFELYDACLSIENIFNLLTIKAGRQKLAFGDYRIFGPGSWGNTGRWTWDAVLVTLDKPLYSLSAWYGGTKIHDPVKTYLPFTHTEYNGGGVQFNLVTEKYPGIELYAAHKHQGSEAYIREKKINRNWIGFRLFQPERSNLQYETSFTYQSGEEENVRLNASGLFLKVGYRANQISWKPTLSLRYSRATGNNTVTLDNELFDPVYGAADRYYGWMNLVRWSNLDDREIMLEVYPVKSMRIEMKYNQFRIPEPQDMVMMGDIMLPGGETYLGDEWDLFATYDLNERWQFTSVLGYFFMKHGIKANQDDPGNAFLVSFQVLYTFEFGKSQQ
ncbi:MAG: alginate export family protein [Bacteroidales bacterium]|nr:alginate export family protein [Bacteroidales bacterium]